MTWRRCARRWEKTSDARIAEERRGLGDRAEGLLAAASLRARRPGAKDLPLRPAAPGDDAEVRGRRRFGYRRLHILLRREGIALNHKKLLRLYREERFTVRRRGGRKRALGTRVPMAVPQAADQRWSLDFASDGRRFRVLVVVDDFTRECLALVADASLSGRPVAREFDRIAAARGLPLLVVSDNSTELTSHAVLGWQQ